MREIWNLIHGQKDFQIESMEGKNCLWFKYSLIFQDYIWLFWPENGKIQEKLDPVDRAKKAQF